MGGRGKASGAARRASTSIGSPMNFGDPGAVSLEQLEATGRFAAAPVARVAEEVESVVRELLAAPAADYERRQEAVTVAIAEAASEMRRRPLEEREAFSERLAPLFAQLREQAEETS